MKKIVIIGAQGLLGFALQKRFAFSYEVIACDRHSLDLTDFTTVAPKLAELNPDYVINCSAYNGVDLAESNPETQVLAEKINGHAVGNLAKICKQLNVPLVHFSTDYVFDGQERHYQEDSIPNPINKYGASKALGEKLLQANTDKYYLVRISRLFGHPGDSPTAKKSFVDIMLDLVAQGKQEITLVAEEFSCPTYSVDVADFVFDLIKHDNPFGIYHGCNSGTASWYELASAIFKYKNITVKTIPVPSDHFPRPAKRPLFAELLNTKTPLQRSWRAALIEYLDSKNS